MNTRSSIYLAAFLSVLLLGISPRVLAAKRELPPAAASVIKANFPKARITGIGRERERGAWYYEVSLREGKNHFEVEITKEGVIGEIEGKIGLRDVPSDLLENLRKRIGSGKIARIEKHERRGVARNGEFVPLPKPRISYEVKFYDDQGNRREVQLASNEVLELPKEVKSQVLARFPNTKIAEAEAEDDEGIIIYVITLKTEFGNAEVDALADGRILEAETPADIRQLPKGVADTISGDRDLRKSDPKKVFRREMWGTVEKGRVVGRKDVTYVARVYRGNKVREYQFDGRGKLTNTPAWEEFDLDDGDDNGDDDDGDDDDD